MYLGEHILAYKQSHDHELFACDSQDPLLVCLQGPNNHNQIVCDCSLITLLIKAAQPRAYIAVTPTFRRGHRAMPSQSFLFEHRGQCLMYHRLEASRTFVLLDRQVETSRAQSITYILRKEARLLPWKNSRDRFLQWSVLDCNVRCGSIRFSGGPK